MIHPPGNAGGGSLEHRDAGSGADATDPVRPGVRLALGFARGLTIALVPRRRRRVLRIDNVFGGRLSFSRSVAFSAFSVAFSAPKSPQRASNCAINASFSLALSKLKSDGEFIPLSIQIRRRPATPFRTCDSIRRTTGSSAPMQGNQPSAGQRREQLR